VGERAGALTGDAPRGVGRPIVRGGAIVQRLLGLHRAIPRLAASSVEIGPVVLGPPRPTPALQPHHRCRRA
jgi:hypothetical protein